MDVTIIEGINYIRNKDKKKSSTEKLYNYVIKNDPNVTIDYFKERLRNLEENGIITCKGEGKEESFFVLRPITNDMNTSLNTSMQDNINFIDEMFEKISNENVERENVESPKSYERLIMHLQSENRFLKDLILNMRNMNRNCENEEILFLRKEIDHKNRLLESLLVSPKTLNNRLQKPGNSICVNNQENDSHVNDNVEPISDDCIHERLNSSNQSVQRDDNKNTNNNYHNSNKSPDSSKPKQGVDVMKKKVFIIGDSIVNGLDYKKLKKNHFVKVHPHGGATTDDMVHHIKTFVKRKPDLVIIHSGTNDLTNNVDTIEQVDNLVKVCKKILPETKLAFSSLTLRKDRKKLFGKIQKLNDRLKKVCSIHNIGFIDNNNIDERGLSKGKLHLNKSGMKVLTDNVFDYMNSI